VRLAGENSTTNGNDPAACRAQKCPETERASEQRKDWSERGANLLFGMEGSGTESLGELETVGHGSPSEDLVDIVLAPGVMSIRRATELHNICITTQRHSRTLNGTQEVPSVQLKPLTTTSAVPLQGGGRRFDPYSAHSR
jgi:hypothetical protein